MQSLRNLFIARLTVDNRFCRSFCKCSLYIAPVVFSYSCLSGVIAITTGLVITAVSALEHVEVQPVCIMEPIDRRSTAKRMEGHQVILVN